MDLLENNWANPFDSKHVELVCLSSGAAPPDNICSDLSRAKEGDDAFQMFVSERLESDPPIKAFSKRQNLKTFSNMSKSKKTVMVSGRETLLKANVNLFGTMVASNLRDLNIQDVLSHPLGPIRGL